MQEPMGSEHMTSGSSSDLFDVQAWLRIRVGEGWV